ncbi:MAG: Clp protease N-terminal domain-containing protein [Ktedonobacteraceae bacterium]
MEKLLTTEEVADYLRVDVVTIRRLVNRGELTAYRIAGEYRFTEPDIEDFFKRQRVPAGDKDRGDNERYKHFTERARKAMALATNEAQRLGHNYVGTEHLLLGLAREGEDVAARVLSSFNFDLAQARAQILAILKQGQERSPLASKIKMAISQAEIVMAGRQSVLTQRAKKVIEMGVKEAQELGQHYIGTEHLLLGIIREGEGLAVMVLKQMGIGLQELRAKTFETMEAPEPVTDIPPTEASQTGEKEA